jgi:thioredoxin-related protein
MNTIFFRKEFCLFSIIILFISSSLFSQAEPTFKINTEKSIKMNSGASQDISLDVFIPEGNHIYIKNDSAMSFNIPTTFTISTPGFGIAIKDVPSSQKKGEDYILSGKGLTTKAGTYTLTIYETKGRAVSEKAIPVTIAIHTQWCDSSTDKCYKPKTLQKKIDIFVIGEKKVSCQERTITRRLKKNSSDTTALSLDSTSEKKVKENVDAVNWIQSYNTALSQASTSGKNVFLVITAPDWCGYCQMLEAEVFSKKAVISSLNEKFIPLQILDSNPEQSKFQFQGYPTMMMLDTKGKVIADINGRTEDSFLASIKKYEFSDSDNKVSPSTEEVSPTSFNYSIKVTGNFSKNTDGSWVQTINGSKVKLNEIKRDSKYVVLQEEVSKQYYALPLKSKKAFILKDNKWEPFDIE